jgi:hypothetical protein
MRAWRIGTRSGRRVLACASRIAIGSRRDEGSYSACACDGSKRGVQQMMRTTTVVSGPDQFRSRFVARKMPADAHRLAAHDGAEADPVHPVQVVERRVGEFVEYLPGLDERRPFEFHLHPEQPPLVDARPDLHGRERAVEVDEAVVAEAAQAPPSAETAHLPEGRVPSPAHVVEAGSDGDDRIPNLAQWDELPSLAPELDERRRAAEPAVGRVDVGPDERSLRGKVLGVAGVVRRKMRAFP